MVWLDLLVCFYKLSDIVETEEQIDAPSEDESAEMNELPRNLSIRKDSDGFNSRLGHINSDHSFKSSATVDLSPVSSAVYMGHRASVQLSKPGISGASVSQELLAQIGYSNLLVQSYVSQHSQHITESRLLNILPRKPLEESDISHLLPREPFPNLNIPHSELNLSPENLSINKDKR